MNNLTPNFIISKVSNCGITHNPKRNFVYLMKMPQHQKIHGKLNEDMLNDKGIHERRE